MLDKNDFIFDKSNINFLLSDLKSVIGTLIEDRNCESYYNEYATISTTYVINELIKIYNVYSENDYIYVDSELKSRDLERKGVTDEKK